MLSRTFTPFPILKTARLTLRQLAMNDEQEIFALRSDDEINKYLDRKRANTIADAGSFINMIGENIKKNDTVYWAITFSEENTLIGTVGLFSFSDENEKCEVGYELLTNFQGQGVMREALEKVIDYAFNTIGVKRIEAFFHKDNQGSIKLLEKFYFIDSNEADKSNPDLKCYYLEKFNQQL